MNNFYKVSRARLVSEVTVASKAVASGKITGFLPAQNAAIAAELAAERDLLAAENYEAVTLKAASIAATAKAQARQKRVARLLSDLNYSMRGVNSPPDEFEAVGFKPPAGSRSMITPQTPTGLAATGQSNGINTLTFDGNNEPGSVTYVIYARCDRSDPYLIVGTCTTQKFGHQGVVPGQFYEYQIRAQASRGRMSEWSNTAVVYPKR